MSEERWLTDRILRLPDGTLPHLGVRGGGDVAEVALLSGSPERVELLAARLSDAERVGDRRGYSVVSGTYEGARITVATSGVGSPSLAIAVEELGACGARTFMRVGSCASIADDVSVGDVVIAFAAVADEGLSRYYAPAGFPPVASPRVLDAQRAAAERLGVPVHLAITRSTDSFYEGERRSEVIRRWRSLGVSTFEMETSALFVVAAVRGWEAGSILVPGSNLVTGVATYRGEGLDAYGAGQERMLRIALASAADLARG